MSEFTFPNDQPIVPLDSKEAFSRLTDQEKLYAHYLTKAAWHGGLIVLYQTSPESPLIYLLLQKLFRSKDINSLKKIALEKCNFTEDEFTALKVYACGFLTNMGNYKGFGDSKFIPNLPKEKFESLVQEVDGLQQVWTQCGNSIYSLDNKHLGFSDKGETTYFSKNCTKKDSELVNLFFKEKSLEAYNTRLFKTATNKYEVRLASVANQDDNEDSNLLGVHKLSSIPGSEFTVTRGDYSPLLALVNHYLALAKKHSANDDQFNMLDNYIHSFRTGSLNHHKDGSRSWIKDKGPVVETYIGFIETYRDPAGMRGEFEGFVAMVNKAMSTKFAALVENSEVFIPYLPWPPAYEKNQFLRPDFTSLDVLCFAGSGIPSGICIPNYDEVRQNEGFKNVSLGNVISSGYKDSSPNYLDAKDIELFNKYRISAFELQVGLHELLGHGSGKLFQKNVDGTYNFDLNTENPETKEKVSGWYDVGETYDSVFTSLGSSYEECRAECVGLYLSTFEEIKKVFGIKGEDANNVLYVNWLLLLNSGLEGLQMYDAASQTWLQAHSQARFVILQVLLEAGEGLITLTPTTGADSKPDMLLKLDSSKILSVGKPAIGNFLRKLQVYKSTADIKKARELYDKYSALDKTFLEYQEIVQARKKPRKIFIQPNTEIQDGSVVSTLYEGTTEGLLQSWVERFDSSMDSMLYELWSKDQAHFQ